MTRHPPSFRKHLMVVSHSLLNKAAYIFRRITRPRICLSVGLAHQLVDRGGEAMSIGQQWLDGVDAIKRGTALAGWFVGRERNEQALASLDGAKGFSDVLMNATPNTCKPVSKTRIRKSRYDRHPLHPGRFYRLADWRQSVGPGRGGTCAATWYLANDHRPYTGGLWHVDARACHVCPSSPGRIARYRYWQHRWF